MNLNVFGSPELAPEEPCITVVRLLTDCYATRRGLFRRRSLIYLRHQCHGYDFIEEDVLNIGANEVIPRITNLDETKDGIYQIVTCNERRDYETGFIEDYDYQLIHYQRIMKFKKTDGIIEIGTSGCCCPPGEIRKGQHTNSCTSWYRITASEDAEPGAWKRLRSVNLKFVREVETCKEFETSP